MKRFLTYICEVFDEPLPHQLVRHEKNWEDEVVPGVYQQRKLHHEFRVGNDIVRTTHEIFHPEIDEYTNKPTSTHVTLSFTRRHKDYEGDPDMHGRSDETFEKGHDDKSQFKIFGTVGHITNKVLTKYAHGPTEIKADAHHTRVPAYKRLLSRLSGNKTTGIEFKDDDGFPENIISLSTKRDPVE